MQKQDVWAPHKKNVIVSNPDDDIEIIVAYLVENFLNKNYPTVTLTILDDRVMYKRIRLGS